MAGRQKALDLKQPQFYINRELSLLAFNRRVIEQAKDNNIPLFERLHFLCIAATNLDEFFEIRVAGLKQQVKYHSVHAEADNLTPKEVLKQVSSVAHEMVDEQYHILNNILLPELVKEKIQILSQAQFNPKLSRWIKRYFRENLLPVLAPMGLDPAHPFPRVLNKNLYFIVSLRGKDAFGRDASLAIIQAPRSLPRVIPVPNNQITEGYQFVLLSSIIHKHVADLFPSMKVTGCYQFRVTRNSDLFVDDEEIDDLLRALEGELPARRFNDAVRLEVASDCPEELIDFLLGKFELSKDDLYQVKGPVNPNRLLQICNLVDRPDLIYPSFTPDVPPRLIKHPDVFQALQYGDILLYHPFQSFAPVVDFLRQAAHDPNVLSIKQTLYRTGTDSAIVECLQEAARKGKEVTVVIELRARFDEEANIELANVLQESGAHVVYGVVGYKTHAKMILVLRREGKVLRRYVHLGTGNYHARTARLYTDYGLLSCDPSLGEDVNKLFHQLTALGKAEKLKKILQAPFSLHKTILDYIAVEKKNAALGAKAHIIAKMNSLVDPTVIRALYEASQSGVKIDLIIRGVCCLRPGIPGISENIKVISVVGRFLEHTRIYYFYHGGKELLYCASADWMQRNFLYRVESAFPIEEKRPRAIIMKYGLLNYLADNGQSWVLRKDGTYKRHKTSGSSCLAQQVCLDHFCKT